MKEYKEEFEEYAETKRIKKSTETFKIKLFLEKGENSLLIAKYIKDIEPTKDQPKKIYWDLAQKRMRRIFLPKKMQRTLLLEMIC